MDFWTNFEKFIDKFVSESIRDFFDFFSLRESRLDPSNEEEDSKGNHNWIDLKWSTKDSSEVCGKVGMIDYFYSSKNKDCTEDDCSQYPIKEYFMLVSRRNLKKAKNQNKDKQVIYGEGFFNPIGCLKLTERFKTIFKIENS